MPIALALPDWYHALGPYHWAVIFGFTFVLSLLELVAIFAEISQKWPVKPAEIRKAGVLWIFWTVVIFSVSFVLVAAADWLVRQALAFFSNDSPDGGRRLSEA